MKRSNEETLVPQKHEGRGGEGKILDFRLGDWEIGTITNCQLSTVNYQLSTILKTSQPPGTDRITIRCGLEKAELTSQACLITTFKVSVQVPIFTERMVIRMQHKPCPPFPLATDLGTGTVGVSKGEDR